MPKNRRSKKPNRQPGIKRWPVTKPENYLSLCLGGHNVGNSTGATTIGSWALNDYLFNSTPAHISLGTGTNLRLGKHLVFTRLILRLYVNQPAAGRIRLIIGKNEKDSTAANMDTNAKLTAWVESAEILEGAQFGSTIGPVDHFIAPSTDYTIIHDKQYGVHGDLPIVSTNSTRQVAIEVEVPLMLRRTYNNAGNVDMGSWFMYLVTTASTGTSVYGTVRLEWVNTWSFESLGRGLNSAIEAADSVLTRATKSPAVHLLARYLPSVFGI